MLFKYLANQYSSRKDRLVNFPITQHLCMIHDMAIGTRCHSGITDIFQAFCPRRQSGVEPIFLPSSADAAESSVFGKLYNDYQQKSAWAWGVLICHFLGMFMQAEISFVNKSFALFESLKTTFSGLLIGL